MAVTPGNNQRVLSRQVRLLVATLKLGQLRKFMLIFQGRFLKVVSAPMSEPILVHTYVCGTRNPRMVHF
jgi:hypothetical protein